MEVSYKTNKLKKECTNASVCERTHGSEMAVLIFQRIAEIQASPTVEFMIENRIGRCHALKFNRKGQYAVDLVHPFRMVFEKQGEEIQIARITEITDYH